MESKKFNFEEALCCLKCGQTVRLGEWKYYLDSQGNLIRILDTKKESYPLVARIFLTSDIMSNNWELVD